MSKEIEEIEETEEDRVSYYVLLSSLSRSLSVLSPDVLSEVLKHLEGKNSITPTATSQKWEMMSGKDKQGADR